MPCYMPLTITIWHCWFLRSEHCIVFLPSEWLVASVQLDREDEVARITNGGGQIINWGGLRVGGILNMTRAIGFSFSLNFKFAWYDWLVFLNYYCILCIWINAIAQLYSGETFYLFVNDRSYHKNFKKLQHNWTNSSKESTQVNQTTRMHGM